MNVIATPASKARLSFGLDVDLPDEMFIGKGAVLPLRGWCYSTDAPIRTLDVVAGDRIIPVPNHSWGRTDIFSQRGPDDDPDGNSLLSGFEAFVPFESVETDADIALSLRATLDNGDISECPLGNITLRPGYDDDPVRVTWPSAGPRVVICMAIFQPPLELFLRQVESIRSQTHANWVCIISDDNTDNESHDRIRFPLKGDKRFLFFQNSRRLNFYENFQQLLRRTPPDADYIALCDQDDIWHPTKLETLMTAFEPGTQLAYSDARVVDENGALMSETFWSKRRNNYTDLSTLMVANTITGAASMIRPSLLPDLLPFPAQVGPAFHDHWIGLVALLRGKIAYVDKPLYDYVQHRGGVIGHNYYRWPGAFSALLQVLSGAPSRSRMARIATLLLKQALDDYQLVTQKVMLARILLLRNPDLPDDRRTVLRRFSQFETSLRTALAEKFRALRVRRPTLNLEGLLLWSMIGARLRNRGLRAKQSALTRRREQDPGGRLLDAVVNIPSARRLRSLPAPNTAAQEPPDRFIPALEFGTTRWIHHNIKPLTLDISSDHPKRVNLLLATINFSYVFGGYIGMFSLALRLRREGYRSRIILHENTDWDILDWRSKIQKYPGITSLFDEVEIISRFDRNIPVDVNPDDRFVATNCWAAHIAHHTAGMLENKRFLFMAQEYEPFFLPMNSISALFRQAYDLPQFTLFSTELLQDFFRRERIGIYARADGDANAGMFSNAIQTFHPTRQTIMRKQRRLLFYARTEEHAARNLFELGIMAIVRIVADPRTDLTGWSFHGIGSLGGNKLELADGLPMELVPKTDLEDYIDMMPSFDVGLSLMLTPHPSLVPIEMAAAGMWVVTNTFANKTADQLRAISTNIIGVAPTIDAICDGLLDAMARVDQIDERLAGSRVNWPTDWSDAFSADSMARVRAFLGEP